MSVQWARSAAGVEHRGRGMCEKGTWLIGTPIPGHADAENNNPRQVTSLELIQYLQLTFNILMQATRTIKLDSIICGKMGMIHICMLPALSTNNFLGYENIREFLEHVQNITDGIR
ncbi:hypothetical protein CBL_12236 [Carabus blaptoides fortunei]